MDLPLPDVLNVAIGLVVLYFLLSTIGATIVELLSRALRYREEILIATVPLGPGLGGGCFGIVSLARS